MHFPFLHPALKESVDHPLVVTHEPPEQNTCEGGEFLDDSLRTEDVAPAGSEELTACDASENESLGDALHDLQEKGYEADLSFEVDTFALYGGDLDMRLNPEAYHVDEIDLVDDPSTPSDEEAFVFAISLSTGVKGVLVDKTDHP